MLELLVGNENKNLIGTSYFGHSKRIATKVDITVKNGEVTWKAEQLQMDPVPQH